MDYTELYDKAKALVNVLSEEVDDYPDMSAYRHVMSRRDDLAVELGRIKEAEVLKEEEAKARKELMESREKKAQETWEDFDLGYSNEDDVHIEAEGWNIDGNHYSIKYYMSVNGDMSSAHCFSVEFKEGTSEVI